MITNTLGAEAKIDARLMIWTKIGCGLQDNTHQTSKPYGCLFPVFLFGCHDNQNFAWTWFFWFFFLKSTIKETWLRS